MSGLLGLDLAGNFQRGRAQGLSELQFALEASEKHRQREKENTIREAIAELAASKVPYNDEERAHMALAMAANDVNTAAAVNAAAFGRIEREQMAAKLFPAKTLGPVEPVDNDALIKQQLYGQGGMGAVTQYQALSAPSVHSLGESGAIVTNKSGGMSIIPGQAKPDPYRDWAASFATEKGRPPSSAEIEGFKRSGATTVNVGDRASVAGVKAFVEEMPKLRAEASANVTNIDRIDRMVGLLNKGYGGKTGQVRAWLAPYAEAAGMDTSKLSEAQTYELLARTLGGSLRMAIVGGGQISNYEQQLLQKVNAGGDAATGAARELLGFYRESAVQKINDYNNSVDDVGRIAPEMKRLYRKFTVTGATPTGNKGIPSGSSMIPGKVGPNGRPVWRAPNGKYFEE